MLWGILGLIVGVVVGTICISRVVLISSYGLPLTIRLMNRGYVNGLSLLRRQVVPLTLSLVVITASVVLFALFIPKGLIGFALAASFVGMQLGGEEVRRGRGNLDDYLHLAKNDLDESFLSLEAAHQRSICNLLDVRDIPGNELFFRVLGDLLSNAIASAFWVIVAIGAGWWWWWAGILVAVIFALIEVLDLLRTAFRAIIGMVGLVLAVLSRDANNKRNSLWFAAALIPRIAGVLIGTSYLFVLYGFFFDQSLIAELRSLLLRSLL